MTRTEAINHLKDILCENNTVKHSEMVIFENEKEALKMAINSLEVDEMYQLEKEDADEFIPKSVIEDIKAEIKNINLQCDNGFYRALSKDEVIEIINNHINGKE